MAKWIPVLAMTLLVSACTGSSDSTASETSVTTAAPAPTTTVATTTSVAEPETTTTTIDLIDEDDLVYAAGDPASVEAELETAYYRSWDAFSVALADPSTEPPELELAQAGDTLEATRAAAKELRDEGQFALSGPQAQFIVQGITVVDETHGLVDSCGIDDGEFYNLDDPDTKIAGGIFTIQWTTELDKIDGRWKVTNHNRLDLVEGIGGCASFEISS